MGHINPAGYDWVEDGEDHPERLPVVVNVPAGSLPAHVEAELADGVARDGNGVVIEPEGEAPEHMPLLGVDVPADAAGEAVVPEAEALPAVEHGDIPEHPEHEGHVAGDEAPAPKRRRAPRKVAE